MARQGAFTDQRPPERFSVPRLTAPKVNVRAAEQIGPQRAPDPERPGDIPARPARQQIFQEVRVRSIRAVMRDAMFRPLHPEERHTEVKPLTDMPRGRQLPFTERANIARNAPEAYGSLFRMIGNSSPYPTELIPIPSG